MPWETNLVIMTRVLISDLVLPYKYSDEYLEQVLVAAGLIISQEVPLTTDYTFDISARTITPDPVDTNDMIMQALMPLKAACILDLADFKKGLGQGIRVRDGDSAIDTSVSFRGYRDILEYGACKAYADLRDYLMTNSDIIGAQLVGGAVLSPYRGSADDPVSDVQMLYDSFGTWVSANRFRNTR